MYSFHDITKSIEHWLSERLSAAWVLTIESLIVIVLAIALFAVLGLILVWLERKVAAHMQLRLGPNRLGPAGIFQTSADTLKLILKEGLTPDGADKFLFNFAPFVVMIVAMLALAPIGFAKDFHIWDVNIGVLYVTAISSLSRNRNFDCRMGK